MMYGNGYGGGFMMLFFWIFLIVALVFAARGLLGPRPGAGRSARELLDEAYARGDLSREQYQQKRADLGLD